MTHSQANASSGVSVAFATDYQQLVSSPAMLEQFKADACAGLIESTGAKQCYIVSMRPGSVVVDALLVAQVSACLYGLLIEDQQTEGQVYL